MIDEEGCTFRICVRYEAPDPEAPVVAVIGDSIARSLDAEFIEHAKREGWTVVMAASGGCRISHLLTSGEEGSDDYEPCFEATPALWQRVVARWEPDLVIAIDNMETYDFVGKTGGIVARGTPDHLEAERRELAVVVETFTEEGTQYAFMAVPRRVTPPECLRQETAALAA